MPEGDTIAYAANRIRPVLEGYVPDQINTPQRRHALDRWAERLAGRTVTKISTHGKHLFVRFEGELVLHSHLGMTGAWAVYEAGRRWRRSPRRAWIVIASRGHEVIEFDGPLLELMTEGRTRFDQRLAGLGPDVLATEFDAERFVRAIRSDDQTRTIGDALLDQRNVAGIGNIWKSEGCWEAAVDPWRRVESVTNAEAIAIIDAMRPRMSLSAREGPLTIEARVYGRAGRPCPRCGTVIVAGSQGDANRTTYWCPGCQT
jgi:endonuclease VIII